MFLRVVSIVVLLVALHSIYCDKESTDHGAASPHEAHDKRHKAKDHLKEDDHDEGYDHESILGSKKDAEEFDQLPPEVAKKRLRVLAEQMDQNKDGVVDRKELTDWIEKSLKDLDQEEADERYDEVDGDHDGFITFDEYQQDAYGDDKDDDGRLQLDEDDMHLLEEDKRYFEAADVNSDGKLDKNEFAAFQNPEAHDHMIPALIKNTLAEKDKNNDGKIDVDEFIGEVDNKGAEWVKVEQDRFKNEYDTNKDGLLDNDELRKWLVPDMRETAEDETTHLFDAADKDRDHKLTYDEIVDQHELFVGSEATNYGDHLSRMRHAEL